MQTTHLKAAPGRSRRQELKDLERLETSQQIQDALTRIANRYGKVRSISQLVLSNEYRRAEHVFFINFEQPEHAMAAARELEGLLYGFSALVVTVPKNGFGQVS